MLGERLALGAASDPPVVVEIRHAVLARHVEITAELGIVIEQAIETDDRDVGVLPLLVELLRGSGPSSNREP
jgi:hypothetical protein